MRFINAFAVYIEDGLEQLHSGMHETFTSEVKTRTARELARRESEHKQVGIDEATPSVGLT